MKVESTKELKRWFKDTEFEAWCEKDCPHLKDGFCTFYDEELFEEYGYYLICEDCYEANHAKV